MTTDHVLILRTCNKDLKSYLGFQWPAQGPVECPDWSPLAKCGNGLHGMLKGEGDASLMSWDSDAKWVVVRVRVCDVVDLAGKVKFPRGEVLYSGDRLSATDMVRTAHPDACVIGGTATAGEKGTATAGKEGTATAGNSGTATAGEKGIISLTRYDESADRVRLEIGYIGENGLKANVAYKWDLKKSCFVEAA